MIRRVSVPQGNAALWVHVCFVAILLLLFSMLSAPAQAAGEPKGEPVGPVEHVIHISVDGLRADILAAAQEMLPSFYRMSSEGAYTYNARTDYNYSITLPNHISQLTGRRVTGPTGHNWTKNSDPDESETLHSNKGEYVASIFDVAHDRGLTTGAYVSKSKFILLDRSYDAQNGAPDQLGVDNGRDKIDTYVYESDTDELVDRFIHDMKVEPYGYVFIHLRDPDSEGHWNTWNLNGESEYREGVEHADHLVGRIMDLVENSLELSDNTVIVLTSDHGGDGFGHSNEEWVANYTIPFFVWGQGVENGEAYSLNMLTRRHPNSSRPSYAAPAQPIRNGDAANLSASLLGVSPVPGSTINAQANLAVLDSPASTPGVAVASRAAQPDSTNGNPAVSESGSTAGIARSNTATDQLLVEKETGR